MIETTRRQFLRIGSASALAGLVPPFAGSANAVGRAGRRPGANDRIRVGIIGVGFRGKYLIGNLPPDAEVVALCDCSGSRIDAALRPDGHFAAILDGFLHRDASRCSSHRDYRSLLDRPDLDAVMIATPDHHHVQAAILAMRAGLDVYLEKPVSRTIAEGRALVDAVHRTGRVLQVGSQQRSMEYNRFACAFVRDGGLGRIRRVDAPCYPGPLVDAELPSEPVPSDLDWDLFRGPTGFRPYNRKLWDKDTFEVDGLLWRGWDLWDRYSGHMMTNWGGHSVDMVQLALGRDDTGPVEIRPVDPGDVAAIALDFADKTPPPPSDHARAPDVRRFWPVNMRYADGVELAFRPGQTHLTFQGERGRLEMERNHFEVDPPELIAEMPDPRLAAIWEGEGNVARPHVARWLDAVRGLAEPNAPAEAGHRTATICHLANIARRLARPLRWDPASERFQGDEEANRLLDRPRRPGFELPGTA